MKDTHDKVTPDFPDMEGDYIYSKERDARLFDAADVAQLAKVVKRVYAGMFIIFLFLVLWWMVLVTRNVG